MVSKRNAVLVVALLVFIFCSTKKKQKQREKATTWEKKGKNYRLQQQKC